MSAAATNPGSIWTDAKTAAGDIKLSHSVFALPFAVLGAFLARDASAPWSAFLGPIALVVVCMVLARTWAMLINRLADARFDARNPRTRGRAVASGRLSGVRAAQFAGLCAGGFLLACLFFLFLFDNLWPAALGTPVLLWLGFYSFAKRFTWWCHVLLGSALGIAPLAAALAVRPESLAGAEGLALLALAGFVTLWVAGFDVIYALQDRDFDRAAGLYSIPARFGVQGALTLARLGHALAAGLLGVAAWLEPRFGVLMALGVGIAIALLVLEHVVLTRHLHAGRPGLEMRWFTLNGLVAVAIGGLGVADVLLGGIGR
jgi:4-hydroxybenzoate polyprenyltransferase